MNVTNSDRISFAKVAEDEFKVIQSLREIFKPTKENHLQSSETDFSSAERKPENNTN